MVQWLRLCGSPAGGRDLISGWRLPCSSNGEPGSIPGLGRASGEGNGNPVQYSCLENSMDRGAWWATVCGVVKSWTQLSTNTHTHGTKILHSIPPPKKKIG